MNWLKLSASLLVLTAFALGAEEPREVHLQGFAGEWSHPATEETLTIPADFRGDVLSPVFPLPKARRELLISFHFRVAADFQPGKRRLQVLLLWFDRSGKNIGYHHQHPWFTWPANALQGKWLPFHRPVAAESIPERAEVARLVLRLEGEGRGEVEIKELEVASLYRLIATEFAAWFEPGKTVGYRGELPPGVIALTGIVTDSSGKELTRKTVSRSEMEKSGWNCPVSRPGFHTLHFLYRDGAGKEQPVTEVYYAQDIRGTRFYGEEEFRRDARHFAVSATAARPPEAVPSRFGAHIVPYEANLSYVLGFQIEDSFRLKRLLGANYLRVQAMRWNRTETAPGVFDWEAIDRFLALAEKYDYPEERIDMQLLDTPPFYSSFDPKLAGKHKSDVPERFPPKEMASWERFVAEAVRRYPRMRSWELWNEPHMPGNSVFWKSTPEAYVELLKSGYRVVKSVDPAKPVALGGIGMRYLPFYDRILELGAGDSFDIVPLHGSWTTAEPFRLREKNFQLKPKRYINNEWHSVLFDSADAVIPTERQLAFGMTLDLLNMLRDGMEEIAVFSDFGARWHGGYEHEMASFRKAGGGQIAGIFRTWPQQEPKLAAVVLRNLFDRFSGDIRWLGAWSLA